MTLAASDFCLARSIYVRDRSSFRSLWRRSQARSPVYRCRIPPGSLVGCGSCRFHFGNRASALRMLEKDRGASHTTSTPGQRPEEFLQHLFAIRSSKTTEVVQLRNLCGLDTHFPVALIASRSAARRAMAVPSKPASLPLPDTDKSSRPALKNKAYDVVLPVTVRDKKGALGDQPSEKRLVAYRRGASADHQELHPRLE